MLSVSRLVEVICESLPQAVLQTYVYTQSREPTALQHVSLFGSLAAAGYVIAMVDFDMDSSPHFRRCEPSQYGLFPAAARRATAVFVGDALLIAGHLAARAAAVALALGALGTTHAWLVPTWLAVEFAVLQAVRTFEASSWRFFLRGADGFVVSAAFNLAFYFILSAAPCMWFRAPFWACPHIWAGGIIWWCSPTSRCWPWPSVSPPTAASAKAAAPPPPCTSTRT